MTLKRLSICILGGIVAAIICVTGMKSSGNIEITKPILLSTIGNRILIGFVIGISGWRIHYLIHGALMGLLITFSTSIIMIPDNVQGFVMYTTAGLIYGFLIELITTNVFKAAMV
jgi:hypothetical protein